MPSLFTVQFQEVVVPLPEGPSAGHAARSHRQGLQAFQVGRYDEAAEHLALAAAHEETAERWNDWGVAQLKDGRPKEAMYAFQLAAHLNPRDTQAVANRNHCRKLLDEGMVPTPVDRGLSRLIAALPEVYQPIFGHPEWSAQASRGCQDRLVWIEKIYRLLEAKLNRPLRVLDLGCAQGYFSLSLAALGAVVTGIDSQAGNIAVCNTLAAGHADWKVRFCTGTVEHVIAKMTPASGFDLVLGLSVFHHIVHRLGIDAVRTMLSTVAENTTASIFEMALAGEPPCWAASQPANPRQLLDGFAFVHEMARNPTHLSELTRPLYVASNRYWFLGDRAEAFDSWKTESHVFAGGVTCGTRRYFFGNGLVAKVFDLEVEHLSEISRRDNVKETAFLRDPPPGFAVPKLLSDGRTEREAWLVREQVPGELLLDRIRSGNSCDSRRVLADILDQLVKLESAGLYHDDIRTWNVLIGPDDRASLIDFGSISPARGDCVWPHDIFLAFLITVQEIANGEVLDSNPRREPLLNPATLPEPYRAVWRVFLEQPLEQWSFALLRDLMERGWRGEIADPGDWPAGLARIVGALMAGCSKIKDPA